MTRIITTCVFLAASALLPAHADWTPDPNDADQVRSKAAIDRMLEKRPELGEFFDQAYGYVIFPSVKRFGMFIGAALGKGFVIQDDQLLGTGSQWVIDIGPQFGIQVYSQVILFQDLSALANFQSSGFEFAGRASVVFAGWGAATDPSYLPEVAIFSMTKGGLMFEAAAGPIKFKFRPLE